MRRWGRCGRITLLAEEREGYDIADRRRVGQKHDEAIDADAEASGWWHALLECLEELLIDPASLIIASSSLSLIIAILFLQQSIKGLVEEFDDGKVNKYLT